MARAADAHLPISLADQRYRDWALHIYEAASLTTIAKQILRRDQLGLSLASVALKDDADNVVHVFAVGSGLLEEGGGDPRVG